MIGALHAAAFIGAPLALLALAGLLTLYVGFSAAQVSHTSWGQALSTDYHERSRIFGWWQAANMLALISLLAVPPLANALAPRFGWTPSASPRQPWPGPRSAV
jgi:Na+/melibiose symporter-like transporter